MWERQERQRHIQCVIIILPSFAFVVSSPRVWGFRHFYSDDKKIWIKIFHSWKWETKFMRQYERKNVFMNDWLVDVSEIVFILLRLIWAGDVSKKNSEYKFFSITSSPRKIYINLVKLTHGVEFRTFLIFHHWDIVQSEVAVKVVGVLNFFCL